MNGLARLPLASPPGSLAGSGLRGAHRPAGQKVAQFPKKKNGGKEGNESLEDECGAARMTGSDGEQCLLFDLDACDPFM